MNKAILLFIFSTLYLAVIGQEINPPAPFIEDSVAKKVTVSGLCQTSIADLRKLTATMRYKNDTIPYAVLVFYRSYIPKMNAPIKKIPIIINDTLVNSLKANMIMSFKILRQGKFRIAVDEKHETEIPVNIKFGKEYFFRCKIEKGLWFGKPTIESVTPAVGKAEAGISKEE